GQPERENWLRLLKFISDSVPQPDAGTRYGKPGSLPGQKDDEIYRTYWDQVPPKTGRPPKAEPPMSGKEAHDRWKERLSQGATRAAKDASPGTLPEGVGDLIQFHIQAIDCRYTDDLKSFWGNVTKDVREEANVVPREQYKQAPEDKGWVVEIAGYTYHADQVNFVRNVLLASLAQRGIKTTEAKPGEKKDGEKKEGEKKDGDKPAGTNPTTTPAAGADKPDDLESTKEPILGRISHIVLYHAEANAYTGGGSLEITNSTVLDNLLKSGGTGG